MKRLNVVKKTPVAPAMGVSRLKSWPWEVEMRGLKFKAILGYIASLDYRRPWITDNTQESNTKRPELVRLAM